MRRRSYAVMAALGCGAIVASAAIHVAPRVIWNASASVPIGFYTLRPPQPPRIGDLVAVMPPERVRRFMVARGTIGDGVPLLKSIAGRAGQTVCRFDRTITVDGIVLGQALMRDSHGRPLPIWRGCRRIRPGEVFLMNVGVPDSMDGRYFGLLPVRTIIGEATPLYTDERSDGRFVWRAETASTPP